MPVWALVAPGRAIGLEVPDQALAPAAEGASSAPSSASRSSPAVHTARSLAAPSESQDRRSLRVEVEHVVHRRLSLEAGEVEDPHGASRGVAHAGVLPQAAVEVLARREVVERPYARDQVDALGDSGADVGHVRATQRDPSLQAPLAQEPASRVEHRAGEIRAHGPDIGTRLREVRQELPRAGPEIEDDAVLRQQPAHHLGVVAVDRRW
jgi:hypothetical protein